MPVTRPGQHIAVVVAHETGAVIEVHHLAGEKLNRLPVHHDRPGSYLDSLFADLGGDPVQHREVLSHRSEPGLYVEVQIGNLQQVELADRL